MGVPVPKKLFDFLLKYYFLLYNLCFVVLVYVACLTECSSDC